MKKVLFTMSLGLFITMFGVINPSYAGGHYVCPAHNEAGECWYEYDDIEYRGKQEGKATTDIIKEESAKAEKEASRLEGKALVEAANAATMEAAVAKLKVAALNNRVAKLAMKHAEDKKKGIKSRGWHYDNCYNTFDHHGNIWWQCYR